LGTVGKPGFPGPGGQEPAGLKPGGAGGFFAEGRMETDIKLQIVLSIFLSMELLGLYMIIIRTIANLEYSFNRVEAIINREVQLSMRNKELEKKAKEKAQQSDMNKSKKNDLLLNIPFMERLNKEKKKDGHA
jgi:hypothetical protein